MKLFCLLSIVGFFLAGCSDSVTSHYRTYKEASADRLFGRGWLPEFIPASSFDIRVSNNLDLNTSHGDFSFRPADAPQFISKLTPYRADRKSPFSCWDKAIDEYRAQGYVVYEYVDEATVWVFSVHKTRGHAHYDLWTESKAGSSISR